MEIEFRAGSVQSGAGGRLAAAMVAEVGAMYDDLDLNGADMPKAGPEQLGPPYGTFLVGYSGPDPVCCGGVKRLPDGSCELKRMYVAPAVRGHGVSRVLLHALEDAARVLGYTTVRLDTGPKQVAARALYESEGFVPVPNFNGNPVATYFGEKSL